MLHSGSKFGIDRELLLYVGNEDRDLLFKRASEPRTCVHDFCADLDRRIVVTALEGTQYQALSGRIKQEQRNILEWNCVGQQSSEAVENRVDRGLRSDGARDFQERPVSCQVAIDGNIILIGRQFRTRAIVMFDSSLAGRPNLVASLHNLSATSDVLA